METMQTPSTSKEVSHRHLLTQTIYTVISYFQGHGCSKKLNVAGTAYQGPGIHMECMHNAGEIDLKLCQTSNPIDISHSIRQECRTYCHLDNRAPRMAKIPGSCTMHDFVYFPGPEFLPLPWALRAFVSSSFPLHSFFQDLRKHPYIVKRVIQRHRCNSDNIGLSLIDNNSRIVQRGSYIFQQARF